MLTQYSKIQVVKHSLAGEDVTETTVFPTGSTGDSLVAGIVISGSDLRGTVNLQNGGSFNIDAMTNANTGGVNSFQVLPVQAKSITLPPSTSTAPNSGSHIIAYMR